MHFRFNVHVKWSEKNIFVFCLVKKTHGFSLTLFAIMNCLLFSFFFFFLKNFWILSLFWFNPLNIKSDKCVSTSCHTHFFFLFFFSSKFQLRHIMLVVNMCIYIYHYFVVIISNIIIINLPILSWCPFSLLIEFR